LTVSIRVLYSDSCTGLIWVRKLKDDRRKTLLDNCAEFIM
jgi:hypothetical protein